MKAYVLDTNLYIEAARDPAAAAGLSAFVLEMLPRVHLHAIVVQELMVGARDRRARARVRRELVEPFERRRRVVVPSWAAWKRSGEIVAELVARKRLSAGGVPRSFLADALLAASCREAGAVLITRNAADFRRIAEIERFEWSEPWPQTG